MLHWPGSEDPLVPQDQRRYRTMRVCPACGGFLPKDPTRGCFSCFSHQMAQEHRVTRAAKSALSQPLRLVGKSAKA